MVKRNYIIVERVDRINKNDIKKGLNGDIMKKVVLALICLLPIPLAMEFYDEAISVQMGMGFASFIAGLLILIFQENIKEFKRLSLIQFIGKIAGHLIAGGLYLKGVNWDGESAAIIELIVIGAVIGFIIQYVIGYLISRKLKRNLL